MTIKAHSGAKLQSEAKR